MADFPARLCILSRMTDPQGEVDETRHVHKGAVHVADGTVTIRYEDKKDGESACVTLTARDGYATMARTGTTSMTMAFVPGERRDMLLATPYGEIPMATDTRTVLLKISGDRGNLVLDYDVMMAGERTAWAALTIAWQL